MSVSLENTRFRQHKRPSLSMIASFTFLARSVRLLRDFAPSAGFCSVWLVRWLCSFALLDVFDRACAAHLLRHLAQLNVFWRILR